MKVRHVVNAVVRKVRENPVRVFAVLVAAVVIGVSYATDTPVSVIVAEVVGVLAMAEKVRERVTPLVKAVMEENQDV